MSYLDYPRLHFSGEFTADPSTVNNSLANYGSPAPTPAWNAMGKHFFFLSNCTVKKAVDKKSVPKLSKADDDLVGGVVDTTNIPSFAKLVDLDPEHQIGSQIWGAEFKVNQATGKAGFQAKMDVGTLRDIWFDRVPGLGFPSGIGGVYQSVLTGVTWDLTGASNVLKELNKASPTKLSIKFTVYAYTIAGTKGKIVGTIGPALAGESDHYLATRRMDVGGALFNPGPAGLNAAFGTVPFKIDTANGKIIVDLGNALPETTAAGPRVDLGTLKAVLLSTPQQDLGTLAFDKANYEITAGIEDIPFSGAALNAALPVNRLALMRSKPSSQMILSERLVHVDASETVVRMDPGDSVNIEITATQLGFPKSGQVISFALSSGTPAAGLTFPATVTTAGGKATLALKAANPGSPRPAIDGQVYTVDVFLGTAVPSNKRLEIKVRVYDTTAIPANPTFAGDVKKILEPYVRLYPFMKALLDLSDGTRIKAYLGAQTDADKKKLFIDLPLTDPRLMPVTRDLSRDKKALLLKWIANGTP